MTLEQLKELSATMKLWSNTSGDRHWLAHVAIEDLIKQQYRNRELEARIGNLEASLRSDKVVDDSIYCIREEYILLEKTDE